MAEEPRVVAGSCAPGIDKRRAASSRQAKRIHAKGGAAPIDVRMKVHETGRDDVAGYVPDHRARERAPNSGDAPALKADVHDGVDTLPRIDDPPSTKDRVEFPVVSSRPPWFGGRYYGRMAALQTAHGANSRDTLNKARSTCARRRNLT